jgi:hypothetical protein
VDGDQRERAHHQGNVEEGGVEMLKEVCGLKRKSKLLAEKNDSGMSVLLLKCFL